MVLTFLKLSLLLKSSSLFVNKISLSIRKCSIIRDKVLLIWFLSYLFYRLRVNILYNIVFARLIIIIQFCRRKHGGVLNLINVDELHGKRKLVFLVLLYSRHISCFRRSSAMPSLLFVLLRHMHT